MIAKAAFGFCLKDKKTSPGVGDDVA